MSLLSEIEAEQVAKLTAERPVPEFAPGDTVHVIPAVSGGSSADAAAPEAAGSALKCRALDPASELDTLAPFDGVGQKALLQ